MIDQHRADIMNGSKSFSLASLVFEKEHRLACWQLYSWCRFCDDQVDGFEGEEAARRLQNITMNTQLAFGTTSLIGHPWTGFQDMIRTYKIPQTYAADLIRGMKWDVEGAKIETVRDLLEYCYCVAGTVGLMMSHITGLNRESALNEAVSLGTALQLTNIARDIREDFERGRIYLPQTWLKEYAIRETQLLGSSERPALKLLTQKLLTLADEHYERGLSGLRALPFRAALAVCAAAFIYREIGEQIRQGGLGVFDRRVVVSKPRKILLLIKATFYLLSSEGLARLGRTWQPVPIKRVWSEYGDTN